MTTTYQNNSDLNSQIRDLIAKQQQVGTRVGGGIGSGGDTWNDYTWKIMALRKQADWERAQQTSNPMDWIQSAFGVGGINGSGVDSPSVAERTNPYETRLTALLDNPESIQQTAAYKFRLGQGQEALQRQLAAKGMLGSGNRLMELTKYGQDMASQEYDNQAKRLSSLVGDRNTYNASLYGSDTSAANAARSANASMYGSRLSALASMANPFLQAQAGNKAYNSQFSGGDMSYGGIGYFGGSGGISPNDLSKGQGWEVR